jgi:pimeloyl-ACP methyl ester carboxylesterase
MTSTSIAETTEASPSFSAVRQIDAGVLNVGFVDQGPLDGPAVVLLHGWPYDIHSFVGVAPVLAARGYRVIVPYLRGYGTNALSSRGDVPKRPAERPRR